MTYNLDRLIAGTRSLEQYQNELQDALARLKLDDPRRGDIVRRIRAIDDELEMRRPL
jgi:hypothetical protein